MKDTILLFVLGLILLIKGGDWFVDAATGIARKFHVPEFIIGATVVSIGTTLPEIMVSATSAVSGHGEIAYGNAVGSVICNAALIAAVTVAVRPTKVDKNSFRGPVLFFFGTAAYYLLNAYLFRTFSRFTGITMLIVFAAYMAYILINYSKKKDVPEVERPAETPEDGEAENDEESGKSVSLLKCLVMLAVGAALIAVGADLLVDKGTVIAKEMGVPESVIALTFVALGTSLPELTTAVTSLIKGHGALSLGNIVGANLFNLLLVCGVSMTLSPFDIPAEKTLAGINASLLVDLPVMMAVMAILTVPPLIKGKLSRIQGIALLAIYAAFVVFQIAI